MVKLKGNQTRFSGKSVIIELILSPPLTRALLYHHTETAVIGGNMESLTEYVVNDLLYLLSAESM